MAVSGERQSGSSRACCAVLGGSSRLSGRLVVVPSRQGRAASARGRYPAVGEGSRRWTRQKRSHNTWTLYRLASETSAGGRWRFYKKNAGAHRRRATPLDFPDCMVPVKQEERDDLSKFSLFGKVNVYSSDGRLKVAGVPVNRVKKNWVEPVGPCAGRTATVNDHHRATRPPKHRRGIKFGGDVSQHAPPLPPGQLVICEQDFLVMLVDEAPS